MTLEELQPLAERYGYDPNHNLRYLALARLVERYNINELLILGCGKGVLEYVLPESVKCASFDLSEKDVNIARALNRGKKNRNFACGDIVSLKQPPFPAILISEVFEHIEDDKAVLDNIKKLLAPNGILISTFPNRETLNNRIKRALRMKTHFMSTEHLREYTRKEVRNFLAGNGFEVIHEEDVYLSFVKEPYMRKLLRIESPVRTVLLKAFGGSGAYLVSVSKKID